MQDLSNKMTGDQLTASEWNELASETQNAIEQSGQTLSGANLRQLLESMTYFATRAPHFTATADGSGDLTLVALPGMGTIYSLEDGMRVRFFVTASSTITSTPTITINGITKDFRKRDGSVLSTGTYGVDVWSTAEFDAANDRWFSVEAGVGEGFGEVILSEKSDLEEHNNIAGRGSRAVSVEAWKHQKKRAILLSGVVVTGTGAVAPVETLLPDLDITLNATGPILTNQFYKVVYDLQTEDVTGSASDDLVVRLDFGNITEDLGRFIVTTRVTSPQGAANPANIEDVGQLASTTAPLAYKIEVYRSSGAGGDLQWRIELIVNATGQPLKISIENGSIGDGTILSGSQVTAELIN